MSRPSLYRKEYAEIARRFCSNYAPSNPELADLLGISPRTLTDWRARHPEFTAACSLGKDAANQRVVESLYNRAVGYFVEIEKPYTIGGRRRREKVREYIPPDVSAEKFWLTNKMPSEWRDKQDIFVKNDHADLDKSPEQLMYELMRDLVDCGAIELKDGVKLLPPGSVEPQRR
jgi:hypothetical protein